MPQPLLVNIYLAKEEAIEEIDQRLGEFNQRMINFVGDSEKRISYVIKKGNSIIAGISACVDWGFILHIELIFVEHEYRHQGLGRLLMEKVEKEAKVLGAGMAQTDTFDFQAKDFYLKRGYEIFGELENSPSPDHKRFYLKKTLGQ